MTQQAFRIAASSSTTSTCSEAVPSVKPVRAASSTDNPASTGETPTSTPEGCFSSAFEPVMSLCRPAPAFAPTRQVFIAALLRRHTQTELQPASPAETPCDPDPPMFPEHPELLEHPLLLRPYHSALPASIRNSTPLALLLHGCTYVINPSAKLGHFH